MQSDGGDISKLELTQPKLAKHAKKIEASYHSLSEWKQDTVGYWLFRIDTEKELIEAGFCKENNLIETVITGTDGEAIYNTIIKQGLVKSLQHAAYIGYELQKAEVALKLKIRYTQDVSLKLNGNTQ
jgi:tetrahydromethanopterin S-methyltransferase subunit A